MPDLKALEELATERLTTYLRELDAAIPSHRVEFSHRITEAWALIYYRRHLVRLSPYLFLLDDVELKHGSHWRELDATLRHEAAHAYAFYVAHETGHSPAFHEALSKLGHTANGACDLGPTNAAYRYVYACPACGGRWQRRTPLKGNWSCGGCAPGRYDVAHKLQLVETRDLAQRLLARREHVIAALTEAMLMRDRAESAPCDASSSSAITPRAPPASR